MIHRLGPLALITGLLAAATTVTACSPSASTASPTAGAKVSVVASFYPLEFAAKQIGGGHVTVTSLTKAGTEPHDLELTPQDVASVSTAQLVVYAKGFQPAVDTAVAQQAQDRSFDVAPTANLDLVLPEQEANGGQDPHFWLDPQRYADVAKAVAARFAQLDPTHAADYTKNVQSFTDKLATLDAEFRTRTRNCTIKDLVTSHAAFGYLSTRYGFTQVPIAGLSPDVEPSAATLAKVSDVVRANHITTIYAETLVEPKFAETIATSTGAKVATLDPIEGLTDASAGKDYLEVMRSNLAALKAGQGCS